MSGEKIMLNASSAPDPANPHLCLFATEAFFNLRRGFNRYELVDESGSIVGNRSESGATFWSGDSAPFCGFDYRAAVCPPDLVAVRVDEALSLLSLGATNFVRVAMKPPHWSPMVAAETVALIAAGFRVERADLNQWIDLPATVGEYESSLKHEARVALTRTRDQFEARLLDIGDDEGIACAYDLLDANRASKGRKLSLEFDYVLRLRDAFPDLVRMLYVVDEVQWRAAALIYRVGRGRDMIQWWGDKPGLAGRSPMNVLARECVAHSIETGARTLDIGISSDHGRIDAGLARFKRSVGAKSEVRLVVAK